MMAHCGGSGLDFTTSIGTIRNAIMPMYNVHTWVVESDVILFLDLMLIITSSGR